MRALLVAGSLTACLVAAGVAGPVGAQETRTCAGLPVTVTASSGEIAGTAGDDVILADSPARIRALGGNDVICDSSGDDTIEAGAGDDRIYSGAGSDRTDAGPGADLVVGGEGPDVIAGGSGDDLLLGAGGADTLEGDRGSDSLYPGAGRDDAAGGPGRDSVNDNRFAVVLDISGMDLNYLRSSGSGIGISQPVDVWSGSVPAPSTATAWASLRNPLIRNVVSWDGATALYATTSPVAAGEVPQAAYYRSPVEPRLMYGYEYYPYYVESRNGFRAGSEYGAKRDEYTVSVIGIGAPGSLGLARQLTVIGQQLGWSPLVSTGIDRTTNVNMVPTGKLSLQVTSSSVGQGQLIDTSRATAFAMPASGVLSVGYSSGRFISLQ